MVVYVITTNEATALAFWLIAGFAAGSEFFRVAGSTVAKGNCKEEKSTLNTSFALIQPHWVAFVGLVHLLVVISFTAGAWVAWSEAYRTEYGGVTRCDCGIGEATFLASFILSLLTLMFVWFIPLAFFQSRCMGNRWLFGIHGFVTGALAIATLVVYFIIDWEAGLLIVPLIVWGAIFYVWALGWEIVRNK